MTSSHKNRCFTIMIVPHSEESLFSLRLPLIAVQVAVAFLVLMVAGLCLLVFSYLKVLSDAREVHVLREINRAQQEEIDVLAVETQRMMEQVKAIDDLVEFVTEKLDLDEEELQDGIEGQSGREEDGLLQSADSRLSLEANRLYAGRSSAEGVLERASENIIILQSLIPERSETLDFVGEYVIQAESKPSIWPARGRISSGFGMRKIPYSSGFQFHTGVDIIGAYGSAIWASASGKVIFSGYRGSYGNMVIVDHGYDYKTYYAHLSDFAVTAGELVERGQTVGYMGASGRTTGTHLHYEVQFKDSPVNPVNYMQ
jgi:murein DD-endopeptidase MepM/ murein hydrolase activator NlpD